MRIEDAWAQLHAAADLAAARGSLLFHLDLATEVARAALAAAGIATGLLATVVDDRGYRVLAFDPGPARRALAAVRFDALGTADVLPAPDRLPPRAVTLAEARATILAHTGADHAAIVIPADDLHAPLEGYALAVGDAPDRVHLADHWLLTLDPRGGRVTARQPVVLAGDAPPHDIGALRAATLAVPCAVPHELHTYLSLKHGVPIFVQTAESGVRWRVDGERTAVA